MNLECGHMVPDVFSDSYTVPQYQLVKRKMWGFIPVKEYQLVDTVVKRRSINCIRCGAEKAIV